MSKPEDISQEVWDRAFYHFDDFGLVGALYDEDEERLVLRCISAAILAAKTEEREAIIQLCEAEKQAFRSPEYAANQPLGSLVERFAISECIAAIRKRGEG